MAGESRRNLYTRIADDLRTKIVNGIYPLDTYLPSLPSLAETYDASPTVVQRALSELKHEGIVEGQPGKGVLVLREPPPEQPSTEYLELMNHVDALRSTVESTFADLERRVSELEKRSEHPDH